MPEPFRRPDPLDPVYKAIAHEGRRRLLTLLADAPGRTVGELATKLPMTRQAVGQHLALLERAGLVLARRSGREKLLFLNATPLYEIGRRWLAPLITREARALVALARTLEDGEWAGSDEGAEAEGAGFTRTAGGGAS